MVAVPFAVAVQGSDKQVALFKPIDAAACMPLGIFICADGLAQVDVETIQDRGLQQE